MAGKKRISNTALKPLMRERDKLIEQWGRLTEQVEAISNKIQGLEIAIAIVEKGGGETSDVEARQAAPATSVKALLIDLAREAKADGLNANIAVKMAGKRGVALKRGTAASNLSRLKTDGALVHDGHRYRLPEFARPKQLFVMGDPGQQLVTSPIEQVAPGTWRVKGS